MKKTGLIILLTAITLNAFWLKASAEGQNEGKETGGNKQDTSRVLKDKDQKENDRKDSDSDRRSSDRRLSVLESLEGPSIGFTKYSRYESWDQDDREEERARRRSRFRGHWSGIELGYNNWVTSDKSQALPSDIDYMTLNSSKSSNFNLNFTQLSLGITRHIGFVTGLGLNWNNYRFEGNNNIIAGPEGIIEQFDPLLKLEKSKLATLYLTLPFMLEMQLPVNHNHLSISAGPIGAIKLSSHTKMVFEDGHTVKSWRDFSLNQLRYGATARVGYGNFQLYGTYYMTPLFRTGKGPGGYELHPFEIGVALTFNN
jgi:hypothetical protein